MVSFKLQQQVSLKRCKEKLKNNEITGSCSLLFLNEFPSFHTIDCHVQDYINPSRHTVTLPDQDAMHTCGTLKV
jgi:hypothetical protein